MENQAHKARTLLLGMAALGLLAGLPALGQGLYGLEPGPLSALWSLAFALLVALWARADARHLGRNEGFSFSTLVFFVWPLALPWYLVKTRGARGLLLFAGFAGLRLAPELLWLLGAANSP